MNGQFVGKTLAITEAAGGTGQWLCRFFGEEGATIATLDRASRYGVRANCVLPGTVRAPIWDERKAKGPNVLKQLERWYPLGRIVEPDEVARVIAFLASDAASAVTGAALPVDCGLTAGNIVMARELTLESF